MAGKQIQLGAFWTIILIMMFLPTSGAVEKNGESIPVLLGVGDCKVLSTHGVVRVANSNPEVLEVVVLAKGRSILLNAKKNGLATINVWYATGRKTYRISVQADYSNIMEELNEIINNPEIEVIVNHKYVILNGVVESSLEADTMVQYAKMYRENVINNLKVKTKYQIMLSVLVTEVKKEVEQKYGIRWGGWILTKDGWIFNEWSLGLIETDNFSIGRFEGNWLAGTMLDELEKNGDAKILAAPSILTSNGQEASFLAGGEIPIPLSDGMGGIKVNWKQYGIKLKAKITMSPTNKDILTMTINPEVSSLDWANAILVSGSRLPAIATRKTETTVQIKDGDTLVIGGLLKSEDSKTIFKLPFLGDLPIIGSLFKSQSFQKGETELLIFVRPRIISGNTVINPKKLTNPEFKGPHFETDLETTNK